MARSGSSSPTATSSASDGERGTHAARTPDVDTKDEKPRPKTDEENRPGAEGGDSEATDTPPGVPADDSSPLGDTDQHSTADA